LTFELAKSLRRLRPQRTQAPLARRADGQLPFVADAPAAGPELLLDTCVYLDMLQGRAPPEVDLLLQARIVNHSTVALAELTHRFGRLDPADARTKPALREIGSVIADIPPHRLAAPSTRAYGEAGILAGLAARLTGRGSSIDLLNDALLYLDSQESGRVLLTANIAGFDYLDQLLPSGNLLFYR
jgi:hypothetical protein